MKKTLIQNATIYDGTGAKPFKADVAVSGDVIERVGRIGAEEGYDEVINAEGLAPALSIHTATWNWRFSEILRCIRW